MHTPPKGKKKVQLNFNSPIVNNFTQIVSHNDYGSVYWSSFQAHRPCGLGYHRFPWVLHDGGRRDVMRQASLVSGLFESFHFCILVDAWATTMQFSPETSSRAVWPSKRPPLRFERRKERKKLPSFVFVLSREDRRLFSRPFLRAKIINFLSVRRFVLRVWAPKVALHFEKTLLGFLTKKKEKKLRSIDWP